MAAQLDRQTLVITTVVGVLAGLGGTIVGATITRRSTDGGSKVRISADGAAPLRTFEARLEASRAESVAESWSKPCAAALSSDLAGLATSEKFRFAPVECRTHTCEAGLTFDNYAAAKHALPRIVHSHYQVNCAVGMHMPPPPDLLAVYQASVLFTCEAGADAPD